MFPPRELKWRLLAAAVVVLTMAAAWWVGARGGHEHGHGHGHDEHEHEHEGAGARGGRCAEPGHDADHYARVGLSLVGASRAGPHGRRFVAAEACADAALALDPEHPEALYIKGLARLDGHAFSDALEHARRVHDKRPDHVGAHLLASDALLEQGQLAAAEASLEKALALKPTGDALVRAAHLRVLHGDRRGAKALYGQVISDGLRGGDKSSAVWAATQAAHLFHGDGDHAGALSGYALALSLDPRDFDALVGRARACAALGRARCARASARRATSVSPRRLPADLRRIAGAR